VWTAAHPRTQRSVGFSDQGAPITEGKNTAEHGEHGSTEGASTPSRLVKKEMTSEASIDPFG
jgi:hypothetical protein